MRAGALAGAVTGAAPSTQRRIGPRLDRRGDGGRATGLRLGFASAAAPISADAAEIGPGAATGAFAFGFGASATTAGRILAGAGCGAAARAPAHR